jgi:hypothetical protein
MKASSTLLIAIGLAWCGAVAGAAEAPRAARSVHLGYTAPEGDVFYTEMVVEQSVNGSYFMACGWDTGYFGIQQLNHPTNKVVIFSVWDPTRGDDPKAVRTEDRVENLFAGEGVRIKRFGGEGTGGQSMAPFPWRLGETNRFVIRSEVHSNNTAYTAWVFDGAKADWRKLATFRTRTGGRNLRGYYSFVEDFRRDTRSVNEVRRARFGNGWVRTSKGEWMPLSTARFTASNATWESKENIDAGILNDWFYLVTGGTTSRSMDLRGTLRLPALNLPARHPDLPF